MLQSIYGLDGVSSSLFPPCQGSLRDALVSTCMNDPRSDRWFLFWEPRTTQSRESHRHESKERVPRVVSIHHFVPCSVCVGVCQALLPESSIPLALGYVPTPGSPIQSAPSIHEQKGFWTSGIRQHEFLGIL